jgi:hypothetical protein
MYYYTSQQRTAADRTRHKALIEMNFENKIVTIKPVDS